MEETRRGKDDGSRDGGTLSDSGFSFSSAKLCSFPSKDSAFRQYVSLQSSSGGRSLPSSSLRPVAILTRDLVETYRKCNPNFIYSRAFNPKRFLTNPSGGELNNGHDNANSDLILFVNLELVNSESKQRYVVKDILGQGTFGQVAKCWDMESSSYVAIKIIKNQPAYYQQALVEVSILNRLNQIDPDDKHHIVRILDFFEYQGHLCISFEMLGSNLYELIRMNGYKGLSLSIVQMFSKQILNALIVMKDAGIIHCDLKPENILISTSVKPTEIKVIDFGSACVEGRTVYSYIQSRYYRSPEVLLGFPYSTAIDMWSFGCIVAELFLGLPLFPGASEYDLLKRMIEILGAQPPDYLLRDAKSTSKFFKHVRTVYHLEYDEASKKSISAYQFLSEGEYQARESKAPIIGKRYFNFVKLEDIITNYPYRKNLPEEEISKESLTRLALVDFIRGLVEFDPKKRWSPLQASGHPFVTGEPFRCPYNPPPETARIPVLRPIMVEHNPGGGHWLATGLSPQVSHVNRGPPIGPHFHRVPMSYGSSYGSLGSHGSYTDNYSLGSSYGSYNDFNGLQSHYSPVVPSGFNMYSQVGGLFLGSSPDARHRPQRSHGNGFVRSPGSLGPMSLGVSPSQFTPPSTQMQIPSASPGKYGPTSPRSGIHGVSLGKAAAVGQYNKRRNSGQPAMTRQPYEISAQYGSGDVTSSPSDTQFRVHFGSHPAAISSHYNWRQPTGSRNVLSSGSSTNHKNFSAPFGLGSNLVSSHTTEVLSEKPECSSALLDPADWDPNYSDESLLQEDNAEVSHLNFEFSNGMHLSHTRDAAIQSSKAGKFSQSHNQAHSQSNFTSTNQRADGPFQAPQVSEITPSTIHDMHACYGRVPHFSQKFPSRFGQQSLYQYQRNDERHHQYSQGAVTPSNYNTSDSHSSTNALFSNSMPWGRRVGFATTLPSYYSGKDYGRIS